MDLLNTPGVPKYVRLAAVLRDQIRRGALRPGDPLPTQADLMRQHGLSLGTVCKAVAELEQEGLVQCCQGRGTFVVPGTCSAPDAATRTVGVVMPVCGPFFEPFAQSVVAAVESRGYNVLFSHNSGSFRAQLDSVKLLGGAAIDGLILYLKDCCEDTTPYCALLRSGTPVVTLESEPHAIARRCDNVRSDNFQGAYDAVSHLIGLGHRCIAYCPPRWPPPEHGVQARRWGGYRQALMDAGWPLEEPPIVVVSAGEEAPKDSEIGERLRSLPLAPTAVFAYDDRIAVRVMAAARCLGRTVPDDLAIIGYDNTRLCEALEVPLTSVDQRCDEMARLAVDLLEQRLAAQRVGRDNPPTRHLLVAPQLVLRRSSERPGPSENAIREESADPSRYSLRASQALSGECRED